MNLEEWLEISVKNLWKNLPHKILFEIFFIQ